MCSPLGSKKTTQVLLSCPRYGIAGIVTRMQRCTYKRERGFTLIEMMVVVAIIA
ncbi:MAG: type IV pilin protein, partial [Vulcanimicrobiaceae bacterium]